MDSITIDGRKVDLTDTISIFEAAKVADIYIPHLCSHPQLDPLSGARSLDKVYQGGRVHHGEEGQEFEGCNLCLVEIQGTEGLFRSCKTMAENGMNIITNSPDLKKARQDALAVILESHPHACLLCPQAEGCDRKVCSVNVPEQERCCSQFGNCELQKVAWFVGMDMGLPPYKPSSIDIDDGEPLILRNYSLCVGCLRCVNVCRDVRGADALGFVIEEGHVVVGSKEPTFRESGCQFCGFCVDVCPTGALTDRLDGVGERETLLIPCKNSCPAGIDVPRYVRLIGKRKYGEALAVIREKVPFPGVLGHVCYHPCETACRRGELNEPVSICALKRFASENDTGLWKQKSLLAPPSGKNVAVIGSGPAGLTAAYYLTKLGHSVTVLEALPEAGGMMRAGISEEILPREILDEEIKAIMDLGVHIETESMVASLDELFAKGYDALFVATGAAQRRFNDVFFRNPDMIKEWGLQKDEQISIEVDRNTLATHKKAVFAGGDIVRGPALVKKKRAK